MDKSFLVLAVAACDPLFFKKESAFFFEKKKQKTFILLALRRRHCDRCRMGGWPGNI
jgi:hypothetical protein